MTLEKARELLGKDGQGLTDEQVLDIIAKFEYLAEGFLDQKETEVFGKTVKEIIDGEEVLPIT